MMFSKYSLFVVAAFVGSAFAGGDPNVEYSCNVGSVQCCDTVQAPGSEAGKKLLGLANASISSVKGQVGANCSPITGIGKGNGAACAAQPTCCKNVYQKQESLVGSIGINCSPVTIIV